MWGFLILLAILSVDAQRFKIETGVSNREGIEISDLRDLDNEEDVSYRLPNNTRPGLYLINLNFGDFHNGDLEFTGNVLITIEIMEYTDTIVIHSAVNIVDVSLTRDGNAIPFTHEIDDVREFLSIKTNTILTKDWLVHLTINYQGTIGSSISGVYRGSYVQNANPRYFIATHMKPTFFRRVCPSFDEPAFKAHFSIVLRYNRMFKSISNMPQEFSFDDEDGRAITIFEQTPLMSSYLIGFVVSDFNENSKTNANNMQFRVFSRPDQTQNTGFALETASNALELYESAFETKYELPKLDQLALPVFKSGGMENYGIVFYQEDYLLYEPGVTTAYDKELAASTIVHEICHKFLGNLLTPHWWSVLWLSEGFCRFYEYYMTQKLYPTMRMEELFAVEAAQSILYRDSSLTTRPMTWYEESPRGVAGLFDGIAYSKSASVIRMFFHSLSEQTFHKGLKIYLSKSTSNPLGVALPQHLYSALQQAADEDQALPTNYKIEELFGSWEKNPGYPVVRVERSYNDYRIRFVQNRFTDTIADGKVWDSLWHIPITYASSVNPTSDSRPKFWLRERQMEITLDDVLPNSYFLVNVKQTGYYRVQYDEANWMLIANELSHGNFSKIPPNSRAMLIDDAAAFSESKILKIRILLELIKYLEHDIDYIPWLAATNNLVYIRRMVNDGESKLSTDFQRFLRVLLVKTYEAFGAEAIEDEPYYHKHIRNIAINWACQAHLDSCISGTQTKFDEFMGGKRDGFSGDHETSLFCNGILMGKLKEFDFMWNLYTSTSIASRRSFYLRSMGCIESEEILTRFIMKIFESDQIDNSNSEWLTIIQATYANGPTGLRVALKFFRENYDALIGLLNDLNSLSTLNSIFRGIAGRINNESLLEKLKELLVIYNIDEAEENAIVALTAENLHWIATYSDDIQDFLDDFFRSSSPPLSTFSYFVIIFGLAYNWIMQN